MSRDLRVNPASGCDHGLRRLIVCTDYLYERYYIQPNPPNLQSLYVIVVVVVMMLMASSPAIVTASLPEPHL